MQLLQTHFLFVQSDDVPSNIQNLGKVNVPELYDITRAILRSWDSSVGIATRYGLEGPGIESRWERD